MSPARASVLGAIRARIAHAKESLTVVGKGLPISLGLLGDQPYGLRGSIAVVRAGLLARPAAA